MRTATLTLGIIALSFLPVITKAQGLELGIFFGISHYQGDLQRSHFEVLEAHHANGLFARYNFNNKLAVKGHFYRGTLSGSDENYPNVESIRRRNLSFQTTLQEAGLQLELTFLSFGETKKHWNKNKTSHLTSAYIFGGVSGFHFNPKAFYQGRWYELQPLGTEGQGMAGGSQKYERFQLGIPVGFGGKLNITHWSSFGFEIGFRKTFTDHIDDVSGTYPDLKQLSEENPMAAALSYRQPEFDDAAQNTDPSGNHRGSVAWKDSYMFAGITLSINVTQ